MSDIIMSDFPQNISVESTPVYQGWSLVPGEITIDYIQGQPMPNPVTVATKFRDIFSQGWSQYITAIKYRSFITTVQNLPVCVVMSGSLDPGINNLHLVDRADISGDMIYTFQNLHLLQPGTYTGWRGYHEYIYYQGDYSDNLEDKVLPIKIRVFPSTAPVITQQAFIFYFPIGASFVSKSISVSGTNWVVRCPKGFSFSSGTGLTITNLADGGQEASGTGTINFHIRAGAAVQPDVIEQNPLHFVLVVNGGMVQIPITVYFVQPSGLFISKQNLLFVAYKNQVAAEPQEVLFNYGDDYTISGLPWLTLSNQASTAGDMACTITPVNADNLDTGVYTGKLYVRNETNQLLGTINVEYRVLDYVDNPYPEFVKAFTLENTMIEFVAQTDDSYYDLLLKAKIYDYYSSSFTEHALPFKIALFKRKQLFNISKIVHRLMANLPDFAQQNDTPYLPAEVSLEITQRRNNEPGFVETLILENIHFVAGRKPAMLNGCGFLEVNAGASRVTSGGYYYLTMLIEGYPTLQVLKNGIEIMSSTLSPGILSRHIIFSEWQAKPGDTIEYRLLIGEGQALSKKFNVFPDGYNSNFIVWETDYKLKSVMEFTGKYGVKSEFENRTSNVVNNLVDVLRKVSNIKTDKLTINTGFLLKSDIPAVESIVRCKRAALVTGGEFIELVPIVKSLVPVDDDRETVSFDIEFEINRSHDEKVYTF